MADSSTSQAGLFVCFCPLVAFHRCASLQSGQKSLRGRGRPPHSTDGSFHVELGDDFIDAGSRDQDFAAALEPPPADRQVFDEQGLGLVGGSVLGAEVGTKGIKGCWVLVSDDEFPGGESVFESIHFRDFAAGLGARAGGALRVRAIRADLSWGCHWLFSHPQCPGRAEREGIMRKVRFFPQRIQNMRAMRVQEKLSSAGNADFRIRRGVARLVLVVGAPQPTQQRWFDRWSAGCCFPYFLSRIRKVIETKVRTIKLIGQ